MQPKQIIRYVAGVLIGTAVFLCSGCEKKTAFELSAGTKEAAVTEEDVSETAPPSLLYVHVCGAVGKEGVYALSEGDRIIHAVEAAGGFAEDADREAVNLAEPVADGMRIRIPSLTESEGQGAAQDTRININTASETELCTLTGIGPSRAADIVRYREQNGAFLSIEEIMNVPGIKDGLFQKIRDLITV